MKDSLFNFRAPADMRAKIKRRAIEEEVSESEMARRLIELGLQSERPTRTQEFTA